MAEQVAFQVCNQWECLMLMGSKEVPLVCLCGQKTKM